MTKRVLDEQKEDVLAQYSDNVTVINKELEDRKYRLKPLLEMVEEARKQTLLLDTEHRQLKHKFAQAQLPNETESLESVSSTSPSFVLEKLRAHYVKKSILFLGSGSHEADYL